MAPIFLIGAAIGILIVIDVLARRFGTDSRPTLEDDRRWTAMGSPTRWAIRG